jgi:hypothetical protein
MKFCLKLRRCQSCEPAHWVYALRRQHWVSMGGCVPGVHTPEAAAWAAWTELVHVLQRSQEGV